MEKLWYYGKIYGTKDKTMVLWTKLWYYTENNRNQFTKEKLRLLKTKKLIMEKTIGIYNLYKFIA